MFSFLLCKRKELHFIAKNALHFSRSLPRAFRHAGDRALVGEVAQTNPAETELAIHGPGTSAAAAAAVGPRLVALRPRRLHDK
jgi:hypothetical protein